MSSVIKEGQNPLEAARFGTKILHGPRIDNFKDVYKLLKSSMHQKKNQAKILPHHKIYQKQRYRLKIKNMEKIPKNYKKIG